MLKGNSSLNIKIGSKRTNSLNSQTALYDKGIQMRMRVEKKAEMALKQIDAIIDAKKPDQTTNRYLTSVKLTKELNICAQRIIKNDQEEINVDAAVNKSQFI